MKFSRYSPSAKRRWSAAGSMIGLSGLALLAALVLGGGAGAATVSAVPLGTSSAFAVLAGSGITDVPTSTIHGNVGVSPITGAAITGLTCAEVTGAIYSPDGAGPACAIADPGRLTTAKTNFTTAYGNAAGRSPGQTFSGGTNQLGGRTLTAGVYRFPSASSFNLIGNLTLSGDASSVWIFQATSDFKTAGSSTVTLTGGAQACNVFWQVGSSATLGGSSVLKGTVLASASITVGSGASISGRLLAQALITLDSDTITRTGNCADSSGPAPARELYCDPSGKAYDLEVGQDKLPPYDKLGLVPAYVDPVTGAKSCTAPATATVSTATTTTATATTATTATTPTPAPKAKPKPAHKTAGVAAAQRTLRAKAAAAAKAARAARAAHTPPQPAQHHVGLTG